MRILHCDLCQRMHEPGACPLIPVPKTQARDRLRDDADLRERRQIAFFAEISEGVKRANSMARLESDLRRL